MAVGIFYPAIYDWTQMYKSGIGEYLSDKWNYVDMLYIWSSIANIIFQNLAGPLTLVSKVLMMIILFLGLIKTFFFLRIIEILSPIVTMLTNVIYDLRIFLFFYGLLIYLFSLMVGILGVGNIEIPGGFRDAYWEAWDKDGEEYPGAEYA